MARRGRIEHNFRLIPVASERAAGGEVAPSSGGQVVPSAQPETGAGTESESGAGSAMAAGAAPAVRPVYGPLSKPAREPAAPQAQGPARPQAASAPPASGPQAVPPTAPRAASAPPPPFSPPPSTPSGPPFSPPPRTAAPTAAVAESFTLLEVAQHLQVSPDMLRDWRRRFGEFLSGDPTQPAGEWPTFSQADVAVLLTIDSLLEQGYSDGQVGESLKPRRIESPQMEPGGAQPLALKGDTAEPGGAVGVGQAIHDVLGALAGGQQAVLNSQASLREMVSVVVQDNFNLKDENRKLRERMLEIERALAEYQRREETRKERLEARMRAMEGTMAALQQQMAQYVQIQRAQQKRRGLW